MQDYIDELDLALINALQVQPRSSWSVLGDVLGVDPVTVARRWERLASDGAAWVTCLPGPGSAAAIRLMYVQIECYAGSTASVIDALSRDPHVAYVDHLSGSPSVLILVTLPDDLLSPYLAQRLEGIKGVKWYRPSLILSAYGEASRWQLRALEPAQIRALARSKAAKDTHTHALDEIDRLLIKSLADDARQSYAALAERAGISEATARRHVNRLISERHVLLRCEVAQPLTGWPVTAVYWLKVNPPELDTIARALSTMAETRLSAGMTGPNNLLVVCWLRDVTDVHRLESAIVGRFPHLEIVDRATVLRAVKRMGRFLDEKGRSCGYLPIDYWPTWSAADGAAQAVARTQR